MLSSITGSLATETLPRANAAARKAIELDEGIAEAHVSLAYERLYSWDWIASEREFQRALDLNPSYATAHFWYAAHLAARGRAEAAMTHATKGQELDPISPILSAGVSWMHHLARNFDGEIEWARRALELDADFPIARYRLAMGLVQRGRFDEAISEMNRVLDLSDESPDLIGMLGYCDARAGRRDDARAVLRRLAELSKRRHVSAYHAAIIDGALGDKDAAFGALEKALEEKAWSLTFSKVEVLLDPLRSDPRFAAVLRRVGAPP